MNPIDLIQKHFEEFTKSEQDIAYYIINNPADACRVNIIQLAHSIKTSKTAIIRFTQKIGYKGYSEFKYDLARSMISSKSKTEESSIIDIYIEALKKIKTTLNHISVNNLAKKIIRAKKIKIIGFNRTYNSSMQLTQRLSKIGIEANASCDEVLIYDHLHLYGKDDLLICFTITDNGKKFKNIITAAKNNKTNVAVITMNNNLNFKKAVDEYIVLPRVSMLTYSDFLDDQAIFFVFIEILLNEISNLSA